MSRNFQLKPAERDTFVSEQLEAYFLRVEAGEAPAGDRYKAERAVLERLIPIGADGFRGITLTAIMGKFVRDDINTSTEFGSINPRPIFENGIRPVLRRRRIPTGGSAPLNVAKNAKAIDESWAENKKPESAALAAVEYIRRINRHWKDEAFRDDLILMFLKRLLEYAEAVAAEDVQLAPLDGIAPITVAQRLADFALTYPEGGALPQFIAGALIAAARSTDTSYRVVEGVDESVFGTNATSNKPADVWEILVDETFGNLYEITCKRVDIDRLDAAVEAFAKLASPNRPITFVCRVPQDCESLEVVDGAIIHRGMTFQFTDFAGFVEAQLLTLTPSKQHMLMARVAAFIAEPSRKIATKKAWGLTFGTAS